MRSLQTQNWQARPFGVGQLSQPRGAVHAHLVAALGKACSFCSLQSCVIIDKTSMMAVCSVGMGRAAVAVAVLLVLLAGSGDAIRHVHGAKSALKDDELCLVQVYMQLRVV